MINVNKSKKHTLKSSLEIGVYKKLFSKAEVINGYNFSKLMSKIIIAIFL